MTESLVDRIKAALDETERVARAAGLANLPPWRWGFFNARSSGLVDALGDSVVIPDARDIHKDSAEHIARHDPASVLRQVAAMRKILDYWRLADAERHQGGELTRQAWLMDRIAHLLAEACGVDHE